MQQPVVTTPLTTPFYCTSAVQQKADLLYAILYSTYTQTQGQPGLTQSRQLFESSHQHTAATSQCVMSPFSGKVILSPSLSLTFPPPPRKKGSLVPKKDLPFHESAFSEGRKREEKRYKKRREESAMGWDGMEWKESLNVCMPIYSILCNGRKWSQRNGINNACKSTTKAPHFAHSTYN